MNISNELQKFIEDNIDLLEMNTKQSWKKIYSMNPPEGLAELFITRMGIDPAEMIGYIPNYYLYKSDIKNYTVPDNVTSIGSHAFEGCRSLTSIKIPASITCIGKEAFCLCDNLTELEFKGTKQEALRCIIGDGSRRWREDTIISRILCSDGVIEF